MDHSNQGQEPGAAGKVRYSMVATPEAFQKLLESLLPASRIAIDIEADSLYHYFDKVCLIQISNDSDTFVLDPLAINEIQPLSPIMADPSVEKVFHAAGYDIHCLRRDYSFTFAKIFDTHIAAQLLGYEQLGLGALLESLLGIAHSKHRQRDDWSRRPLDPEQLQYAAMDTHHLLALRDLLEEQLDKKGRLPWAREEFLVAAGVEQPERQFDPEGYRRIKGSRSLPMQQTSVLRALYRLRDRYARELDLPPFKVINNPVLLDLAVRPPKSASEMFRRPGISQRVARRFAHEICRTIEKARSEDPSSLARTEPRPWTQPSRETKQRFESLRSWRRNKAAELHLDVGVLCPGNVLETLAANPPSDLAALEICDGLRRWRAREFGQEILEVLHSTPA
jgi:ribonuclease D